MVPEDLLEPLRFSSTSVDFELLRKGLLQTDGMSILKIPQVLEGPRAPSPKSTSRRTLNDRSAPMIEVVAALLSRAGGSR